MPRKPLSVTFGKLNTYEVGWSPIGKEVRRMDNWRHPAMNWEEFQKSLFHEMPFNVQEHNGKGIENFVQKTIDQYLPKSIRPQSGLHPFRTKTMDYDLFETHRSIFVRCRLSADMEAENVRFYANRRTLKIECADQSEEISLPSDVNPSRAIARSHEGVLEIRMPKSNDSEPFREIFIREGGK
jgi:HSP20 family molecular chaperone IbpA